MAEIVVNVKIADLEPFSQFIGKVVQANDAFRGITTEEAKALPEQAAEGIAALRSALRDLAGTPTPIYDAAMKVQREAICRRTG